MKDKKLVAFAIDFIITAVVYTVPFYFMAVRPVLAGLAIDSKQVISNAFVAAMVAMVYMVVRDIPKKGSIGKRIMKLKVIDAKTKGDATVVQRVSRNVFWLLGWIEALVYIVKGKRLGDMFSGTELVER